ncbi:MAG: DUF5009 domain-containing protein [Bacteroidales bacterium]
MLHDRVNSIDTTKGLAIIFIVILNFIYFSYTPLWLAEPGDHGLHSVLGAIIYPLFIFLAGATVPFSITGKLNEGNGKYDISRVILAKALILITVGVLLVNTTRVNSELTGINEYLWSILLVAALFMVWNKYADKENNFFTTTFFRLVGLTILVILVFKFKSSSFENNGSLVPGWWELPGLAGWAFLIASLAFLFLRNSLTGTLVILVIFLGLNIADNSGYLKILDPVRPYFGVVTSGFIPVIGLSGLLAGNLIRKLHDNRSSLLAALAATGLLMIIAGLLTRGYFHGSSIYGNPAWALIASGAAMVFFTLVYLLDEVLGLFRNVTFIRTTGKNMTTVYVLALLLNNLAAITGVNLAAFSSNTGTLLVLLVAIAWAALAIGLMFVLKRFGMGLKL